MWGGMQQKKTCERGRRLRTYRLEETLAERDIEKRDSQEGRRDKSQIKEGIWAGRTGRNTNTRPKQRKSQPDQKKRRIGDRQLIKRRGGCNIANWKQGKCKGRGLGVYVTHTQCRKGKMADNPKNKKQVRGEEKEERGGKRVARSLCQWGKSKKKRRHLGMMIVTQSTGHNMRKQWGEGRGK